MVAEAPGFSPQNISWTPSLTSGNPVCLCPKPTMVGGIICCGESWQAAGLFQAIFFPTPISCPSFGSKQLLRIAPGRWELLLSRVTNLTHDRDDRSTAFLSPTGLQLLLSRAVISVPCCWPASRGPRPVKGSLT